MRKKIIVFIAVIVIPILILVIDHFVLNEHIQVDAQYDQSQEWQDIIKNQDDYPTSLLRAVLLFPSFLLSLFPHPAKFPALHALQSGPFLL